MKDNNGILVGGRFGRGPVGNIYAPLSPCFHHLSYNQGLISCLMWGRRMETNGILMI